MTKIELLKAGYRLTKLNPYSDLDKNANWLYQKRVRAEDKTLYFINVYWYEEITRCSTTLPESWAVYVTLYPTENRVVEVAWHFDQRSIQEIEADAAGLFGFLNCVPDPHNQTE